MKIPPLSVFVIRIADPGRAWKQIPARIGRVFDTLAFRFHDERKPKKRQCAKPCVTAAAAV
jgi:hypothetical protein